ncbi:hypothetical protein C100_11070 [Sphingobium sp. C100]|jgi:hypothetical protein|uniref:hypothetical protein n=1 Tax=Sphingobium sp. C100 TaxID=1207055 RepID=UPI0003D5ABFB|nr:hypothetical protein [Sphingobium sp. C100]ETI63752.1 hypothetical protein C100_11070 [Sphingobium sp. C100]PHQ64176.1 MAG: hypothetical protein COC10_02010 [Sphingobium sp.]
MLPDIDLRIANMIKALEQVILPALPRDQRLARDQAMLVAGHLRMIGEQWKSALRYEQVALDDLQGLARDLLPGAPAFLADDLAAALAMAEACDRASVTAIEQANIAIGHAVDAVILGGSDHAPMPSAAVDRLLDYALRHARRERSWFKANRLDPDQNDLPDLVTMLAETN